jgi:hypothetical protein
MRVETTGATGTEQVGHAHGGLAQDQLQVAATALGTDFPDTSKSQYVKGLAFIVEVVDHHPRVQFAQDQTVVVAVLASARWRGSMLRGR